MSKTFNLGVITPGDLEHAKLVAVSNKVYDLVRDECGKMNLGPSIGASLIAGALTKTLFNVYQVEEFHGNTGELALVSCLNACMTTIITSLRNNGVVLGDGTKTPAPTSTEVH